MFKLYSSYRVIYDFKRDDGRLGLRNSVLYLVHSSVQIEGLPFFANFGNLIILYPQRVFAQMFLEDRLSLDLVSAKGDFPTFFFHKFSSISKMNIWTPCWPFCVQNSDLVYVTNGLVFTSTSRIGEVTLFYLYTINTNLWEVLDWIGLLWLK